MPMDHSTFAQLIDNVRASGTVITSSTPVKVLLHSGDIVEVEAVKFSILDGGQIQIVAGPTEEEADEVEREDLEADDVE